jgi:hypothetical protein
MLKTKLPPFIRDHFQREYDTNKASFEGEDPVADEPSPVRRSLLEE